MTTPTNESNEAYERRMEIKRVVEAPKGTKFQRRPWDRVVWDDCEKPEWDFDEYDYRIAPTPKKVLRKAWEILREASNDEGRVELQLKTGAIIVDGFNLCGVIEVEWGHGRIDKNWPEAWFTTEEPKQ